MPNDDEGRDRQHLHVPDDEEIEPGDPKREPIFRDRHGRLLQDKALDVPPQHHEEP